MNSLGAAFSAHHVRFRTEANSDGHFVGDKQPDRPIWPCQSSEAQETGTVVQSLILSFQSSSDYAQCFIALTSFNNFSTKPGNLIQFFD